MAHRTILSDQPPPKRPVIVMGLPTFGMVSMYWHIQTHDLLMFGKPMNRTLIEKVVKGHTVADARNLIVEEALELRDTHDAQMSHVFFLDDDVLVERDTLIRLLSHDRPIVSGLYRAKSDVEQPLLFMAPHAGPCLDYPDNKLVDCYAHGMGCTLIRREVFEAIEPPWFKTEEGRMVGNDFKSHTEDTYFLEKAAAAGFSACVDTGCVAGHYDHKTDTVYMPTRHRREDVA